MTELNPEELSKKAIAKRVVTAKRQYFMPEHGVTVEAESVEAAIKLVNNKKVKEGDV